MSSPTPMINLIPASRLQSRRAASRVRIWIVVVPFCAALFTAAWAINWMAWSTDLTPLSAELEATRQKIKETQTRYAKQGKELREAEARLRANRAVGEQPDWSTLLNLLGAKLTTGAALRACTLEPVSAPAPTKSKDDPGRGRPEELKLTLKGIAQTQSAVSKFILDLEATRAFEAVQLVETSRDKGSDDGIGFEIVCRLTDPGGALK